MGEQSMHELFKQGAGEDGVLDKDEFCDLFCNYLKDWTGPKGEQIDKEMLGDIFDYVDVDMDEVLSYTEFLHAMRDLPEPVLPSGYAFPDSQGRGDNEADAGLRAPIASGNLATEQVPQGDLSTGSACASDIITL